MKIKLSDIEPDSLYSEAEMDEMDFLPSRSQRNRLRAKGLFPYSAKFHPGQQGHGSTLGAHILEVTHKRIAEARAKWGAK